MLCRILTYEETKDGEEERHCGPSLSSMHDFQLHQHYIFEAEKTHDLRDRFRSTLPRLLTFNCSHSKCVHSFSSHRQQSRGWKYRRQLPKVVKCSCPFLARSKLRLKLHRCLSIVSASRQPVIPPHYVNHMLEPLNGSLGGTESPIGDRGRGRGEEISMEPSVQHSVIC